MSRTTINRLQEAGVKLINVSGRGGTNFAMIENRRNHQLDMADLDDWGQTTPESLLEARNADATIIASGGITCPLDVIKAGVLGARAVGVAGYFLNLLIRAGEPALDQVLTDWQTELPRLMTLVGAQHFTDLNRVDFVLTGPLYEYAQQRGLV